MSTAPEPSLSVRDLCVTFALDDAVVRAVDGVSFDVAHGRTVALVGESGSGKSVTALSILRLVPSPPGNIEGGAVTFQDRNLLELPERAMQEVRGGSIGMVFQEPLTSLNPVYTVGFQVAEAVRLHRDVSRREAKARAVELLRRCGLPAPEQTVDRYPHELSGGMRQRVLIAIAVACDPALLVADEPTSALDTTTQAQILELLRTLRAERRMSLLLIAHDLSLVAELADELVVMYAGQVVESGSAAAVLRSPHHPYTQALLRCVAPVGRGAYRKRGAPPRRLPTIEGAPPDMRALPRGCRFAPRCPDGFDRCDCQAPPLFARGTGGAGAAEAVRCFLYEPGTETEAARAASGAGAGAGA